MAGWTTLRVAHAPTHRPSAAHKLHRAQPARVERSKTKKTKPFAAFGHQAPVHDHHGGPQHPQIASIPTINPAQPSARPKSVTFPESPVTFAEIRTQAFLDIPALVKTLDAVVAWDEKTFARWAVAMRLDPADPAMRERRRKAIDGLGPFKVRLLAEREALERHAREYKSPAQIEKEREEAVARNYSQTLVEVDVAGTRFRLPAHYISPQGAGFKPGQRLTSIGFWVFLPEYGYTRDNWREPLGNPDSILIRVAAETRTRPEEELERFLAEGGAETERVGDREATVYDHRKTRARLPVNVVSRHHVFEAVKAGGGPYYAVCDAEQGILEEGARCEVFLGDAQRGLRVSALFRRIHVGRMAEIEERLSAMLESWIVE
jgi:hypothetical protein